MKALLAWAAIASAGACGGRAWTPPPPATTQAGALGDAAMVRRVGMVGVPLALVFTAPRADLSTTPALPAGLALDARTGELVGTPSAPIASGTYAVRGADGTVVTELVLEIVPVFVAGRDRVLAPTPGAPDGDGSLADPFTSWERALDGVAPGATIFLRGGTYRGGLRLRELHGSVDAPITVRAYPGEAVTIIAARDGVTWVPAPGGASDEWISTAPLGTAADAANRGTLGGQPRFTRLLTYSQLGDLRASNERWARDGSAPGPTVVKGPQRPWTYFGPGLWADEATGLVHLRLAPTHNAVPGLADYAGPVEPVAAGVEVSAQDDLALDVGGCTGVELRDLTFTGGGERTARIAGSDHVRLDHVVIQASTYGLVIQNSRDVGVWHTRLDGGMPPWSFRSDFKDDYALVLPDGGSERDNLVRKTSRALLWVGGDVQRLEVAYSELAHAHDVYFAGHDSALHHSWIHDIHDEALFLGHTDDSGDLRVHDNLFERFLSGLAGTAKKITGPRYLFRNVFDLREPIAGIRPGGNVAGVWRYGTPFKSVGRSPTYFYLNTVLLARAGNQAAAPFFRTLDKDGTAHAARWFAGNVIAVATHAGNDKTLAFVPDDSYRAARSEAGEPLLRAWGNVWARGGGSKALPFACLNVQKGQRCAAKGWRAVADVASATGFEAGSQLVDDAGFVRLGSLERSAANDDLRPGPRSPARGAAQGLPAWLPGVEGATDAGAFATGAAPRRIGVDGGKTL